MQRNDIPVRTATLEDVDAATRTLTRAFADNVFTRHVISGDHYLQRLEQFHRLFVENIGIPYGRVWITADGSAASVWTTPATADSGDVLAPIAGRFGELAGDRADVYIACEEEMARHRPAGPVWFLGSVGVDPARQGRGLGRAVIEPGLAAADAESVPAFLETSERVNVGIYERMGFEVTAEYELPAGGPVTWAMTRPAGS
ncbi:GNAT family N-acetyltransferase [Phytoactinopolyspora alkaliphila]|uniref:GNAT family N-acetyltransferase n=1 Tax=Phytoactinopolyspora alkaliphila TaxID=1783498 RepID=UPI001C2091E5